MKNSKTKKPTHPPFGNELAARQKFNNLPFIVVICVGMDAWKSAKLRQQRPESVALVLPDGDSPQRFIWPVRDCFCLIEWNTGPDQEFIRKLVQCLIKSGAELVSVWPIFADYSTPSVVYDSTRPPGERWVQCREISNAYSRDAEEVANAA